MTACDREVSPEEFAIHTPVGLKEATALMKVWSDLRVEQLAQSIGISIPLARSMQKMIYEFPNTALGEKAICAYTGVVFKALDYAALSDDEKYRLSERTALVSSLYGWLRPDDVIKPYRLDYTSKMVPGYLSMAAFWKERVTDSFISEIRRGDHREVIDLLPADASKCIDWKKVKDIAGVWKADFRETSEGGVLRTPRANRLKTLRGLLLREIVKSDICAVADLKHLETTEFMADDTEAEGVLRFLC